MIAEIPNDLRTAADRHVEDYRRMLYAAIRRGTSFGKIGHVTTFQNTKIHDARRIDKERVRLNG